MDENNNIAKNYNPKEFEERLYKWWEESGFFTPEVDKNKKPFTIIMPPPNITGQLHLVMHLIIHYKIFLIRGRECKDIAHYGYQEKTMLVLQQKLRVEKNY